MTGIIIIGFLLFLILGMVLFLFFGSQPRSTWGYPGMHGGAGFHNPFGHADRHRSLPFQAGNLNLNQHEVEENIDVYRQQITGEEEQRLYLNNSATALIIITSFTLFFLVIGALTFYYFSSLSYKSSETQKLVYLLLLFFPFVLLVFSLMFGLKAFRTNFANMFLPGYDRNFTHTAQDNSILALIKSEDDRRSYELNKLIEIFNINMDVNQRKVQALGTSKMLLLFSLVSALPLIIVVFGNYFGSSF